MKQLLVFDSKNYTDHMPVNEKTTVRAIIRRGKLFAMQQSRKGDYKIPGGGVEAGESHLQTLQREVREETGLLIVPDSLRPLGEILELREDLFSKGVKYICHTLYFGCDIEEQTVPLSLTLSEKRMGFHLAWADLDTIIRTNESMPPKRYPPKDTAFLKLVASGQVAL